MLIVDTGPLYAAAARLDKHHERCLNLLTNGPRPLIVPAQVVTEVAYFLRDRLGPQAELTFIKAISGGELIVEPVLDDEWKRIATLMETYSDFPLSVVDASVVTLAERLKQTTIATLDVKHFSAIRPNHVAAFTLVP